MCVQATLAVLHQNVLPCISAPGLNWVITKICRAQIEAMLEDVKKEVSRIRKGGQMHTADPVNTKPIRPLHCGFQMEQQHMNLHASKACCVPCIVTVLQHEHDVSRRTHTSRAAEEDGGQARVGAASHQGVCRRHWQVRAKVSVQHTPRVQA